MRKQYGVDGNEPDIVKVLQAVGATVQHLGALGDGTPDLLVGFGGRNIILEVKDPKRKPSEQILNDKQLLWHRRWRGQVCVVKTCEQALNAIGLKYGGQ
jgi:Holliday junction resolvase